jgi:ABC-type sulfate transport system permease subunit
MKQHQFKRTLVCAGLGVLIAMLLIPYITYRGPASGASRFEEQRDYRMIFEITRKNTEVDTKQLTVNVIFGAVAGALLSVLRFPRRNGGVLYDSRGAVSR